MKDRFRRLMRGSLLALVVLSGHSLHAQGVGALLLQGTQKVVVTAGGCTNTATLTGQYFSAYPNIINHWSDVLDVGESSGSITGSLAYNIPCRNLNSTGLSITGGWSYNEANGFSISWYLPASLDFNTSETITLAFSPGGGIPPIFPFIPVNATPGGVTGNYTDPTFNITINLTASPGPGPTAPTITGLAPVSAIAGTGAFTLTVNGTNFAPGATVQWNGAGLPTTFVSATQMTAQVSANLIAAPGSASITVSSGGQTSGSAPFQINAPGGGSTVTVSTKLISNTTGVVNGSCATPSPVSSFTTSSPQVWLYFFESGGNIGDSVQIKWIRPDGVIYQSESGSVTFATECFSYHIDVSGASAASYPGTWTVQVFWNQSSTPLFALNFTIAGNGPSISSITPSSGTAGGPAFTLTVNGSGFSSGAAVEWNGSSLPTSFVSSTQLTASVGANLIASPGSAGVMVAGGGQTSNSVPFTINASSSGNAGPTLVTSLISNASGIVNNACVTPPVVTNFTTTSPQVWLYFYVTGATQGDAVQMNFIRPDGVIYTTYNATVQFTNECFSYVINIAGASAANYPGTWTVQTFWNQGSAPLFSLNFTLTPGSPPAPAGTTSGLYSSGQNVANGLDKSFQIVSDTTGEISAPNPAFVVNSPGWPATIPGAAWIAPSADQGSDRLGCCSNTSDTYRMTFTLPANGSGLTLNLTMAADDYVDVLLNGQTVYTHASTAMWTAPVNFSISSGFVAGTNTLDFVVTNSGGPTGLIVATSETGPGGITFLNQRVSTQDASLSANCVPPPVSTSFQTTDDTVFLYFEATTSSSDLLSDDWLGPDGTVHNAGSWNSPGAGDNCYFDNLDISSLPSNLLGAWQARVYDNGNLLFTVPFTVGAPGSPAAPASIQIVSGNSQTALVNQSFAAPLVIQVLDSQGNPVSGAPVTWAVSGGGATLFNSSAATGPNGQASTNAMAGSAAGPVTVTATAGPATAQFNLTVTAGSRSLNAIPGQTLNLTGIFNTSATVTTTVVFTDGGSYTVSLPPINVASNTVSVLVPPYWNPQQGFVPGTLSVSVTQQPATGTGTTSVQAIVQVGPLPATGLPPGTIALAVLNTLSQAAATANQTWNTIQQKSLGQVQAARLNIPALQGDISTMQAQVQAFVSGQVSQVCMGQINGQNVCLTADSLAVIDQLYYAFYLGSNAPPGQIAISSIGPLAGVAAAFPRTDIVTSVQSWYSGLVTSTLPQTIRDNAKKLRTMTAIMTGVGTLAAIVVGAPVEVPVLLGAAAYMAINLGSASTAAALEGAGSEILNNDESDFKQTIGILIDSVKDLLEGIVTKVAFTLSGLGEAAENAFEVVKGAGELLNPEDPSSVESETESAFAQNLFNTAANLPLTGNWMGTYNRTPSSGCPAYSGLMSMSTTQNSDGTYSGTFTMTQVKIYDSSCKAIETGNITDGGLVDAGRVTGFDPNGNLTFKGSLDWSLDNSLTYGSFTFTGTLSNGSIQGVFDKGGGTFSLH